MVKMNKKGFIRTLEAVIAIILLLTFVFWLMPTHIGDESETPEIISAAETLINHHLINDGNVRTLIVNADPDSPQSQAYQDAYTEIGNIMELYSPPNYEYQFSICKDVNCYIEASESSVYMNDVLISSDMDGTQQIRIVRMWFYQ
ncbi:MAG: hypothetical protein ABIF40_03170 [archaeon]